MLCVLITATATFAQNGKGPIKIDDPAKADRDFAIQGEYEDASYGKYKVGAQVIARGSGNFGIRMLKGGLPGAGWDGKTQQLLSATTTKDGKIVVTGKDPNGMDVSGTIENGELMLKGEGFALKRVVRKSPTLGQKPPPGAVVLFDKPEDIERWKDAMIADLSDGKFLLGTDKSTLSKAAGQNFKLHLEFRVAYMPDSPPWGRSLSGVYLQNRYELHIRDSFGLDATNSECGSFTTQRAPSVNMCLPPLAWQTYDIDFKCPEFDEIRRRTKPARVTVHHNGVLIHDNVELPGPTPGGQGETDNPGPLRLGWQKDCPVVFRNVWMIGAQENVEFLGEYRCDFRGIPVPKVFRNSLSAKVTKVESEGLRVTISPPSPPINGGGLQLQLNDLADFVNLEDYEVTATIELIPIASAPKGTFFPPTDASTGVYLAVSWGEARIGRVVRPDGKQEIEAVVLSTVADKVTRRVIASPCSDNVLRMRLKRSSNMLHFLWAPGISGDKFEEVYKCAFDRAIADPLLNFEAPWSTQGRAAALDARLIDFRISRPKTRK